MCYGQRLTFSNLLRPVIPSSSYVLVYIVYLCLVELSLNLKPAQVPGLHCALMVPKVWSCPHVANWVPYGTYPSSHSKVMTSPKSKKACGIGSECSPRTGVLHLTVKIKTRG